MRRAVLPSEEDAASNDPPVSAYHRIQARFPLSKWMVLAIVWFVIGLLIMIGLVIGSTTGHHGDFCRLMIPNTKFYAELSPDGVFDEACGITTGYRLEDIMCVNSMILHKHPS